MNFDAMGNYYGAVNDMLDTGTEANVKPVTQTITTDPQTGEQMMTVKGRPQDLSAANPNTPTVTQPTPAPQPQYLNLANTASTQPVSYQPPAQPVAPVQPPMPQQPPAPDQTYQRMIQAESGGQNYAPGGQPLTSPKGAMFAAQVMPATAAAPGYGVRPAAAQTAEEYNRVGQDYYNAMLQKFGNPQAAAAAYNAGPGRVQQNLAANQGQLNVSQLPQETQQYLQRVQPGAAPTPVPAVQPRPMIAGGTTATDVLPTPTEQAVNLTPDQRYANDFIRMQNDPAAMARLRYDQNAPEWVRTLASQKELQDLRNKDETQKVQQKIQTAIENNDGRTIASMLNPRKKDTDEGSIAKAFLFSLIGFQSGANAEVEKMGLKDKWEVAQIGTDQVAVKTNPRGEAKEAIYTTGPNAGQRVSEEQLVTLYGAGAGGKVTTSGTFFQTPDGTIVRSQSDEKGRTKLVDASTGERYTGPSKGLVKLEEAGALRKMDYGLITDLKKQFGTDAIKALTEYKKYKGPLPPDQEAEFLNLYGFNKAQPTAMPTPPPPSGVVTPGAAPVAPAVPGAPGTAQQNQVPGAGTNMRTTPGPVAPTPVTAPAGVPPSAAPAQSTLTTPLATLEATGKAEAANVAKDVNKSYNAKQIYNIIEPVNAAIQNATGSGLGAKIDDIAAFFGKSTEGAKGTAKLNILADTLLKTVPRFEGPQSDKDTAAYQAASGQLADRTVPTETRLAALQTIIDINKKYAPELDWSFGTVKKQEGKTAAPKAGTTKTDNGVTYEYDGRGWKKVTGI